MTVYFYKATDKHGKAVEGDIDAPDYRGAVQEIRRLNYFPIHVAAEKPARSLTANLKLPGSGLFAPIKPKELMLLTQQLSTLVDAGLTLDQSLSTLVQLAEKETTRVIFLNIQKRVHAGSTFVEALEQYPDVFSKLYVNMVRAGEIGGTLPESLNRLVSFMEKAEDLKSNVRAAMVYPCVLTTVGGTAVIVLITVVIPQFSKLFAEMGQALPLPTKIMLAISSMFTDYWWALLIFVALAVAGFVALMNNEKGRLAWDGFLLRAPVIGVLIQKIEVSRFSLTMATLLRSGIPILQALSIVRSILSNRVIVAAMDHLHQGLKNGKGLSGPLQQTKVFPPMAVRMIIVGETSGSLDKMLVKVSETYEKEVAIAIKAFISLLEPLMILMMAVVIGFIVVSMLLAIFSVNEIAF